MNSNADIARRAIYERIFPLSFVEYNRIKNGVKPIKELSEDIRKIFFEAQNAKELFDKFKKIEVEIQKYP